MRRGGGRAAMLAGAAVAGLALAACDDPAPRQAQPAERGGEAPAAVPQGRPAAALQAAEERLRARLRMEGALPLRAVQAHRQALPDTLAICGQINPSGRGDEPWLPWVAVVGFEGTRVTRAELHLAASTPEATRVYFEMVDRCFDGGGPASPRQGIRPLPPAPSELPRVAGAAPAPPAAAVPQAQPVPQVVTMPTAPQTVAMPAPPLAAPAPQVVAMPQGMVTTTSRHPVNVRAAASGAAEVVRVAPRGALLQVFGEAPGGWLQVGDGGEAWGWLHGSLTER